MAQAPGILSSTFVADGVPLNSHHGSESIGKTGAQQEHPLNRSSVLQSIPQTGASVFPNTGAPQFGADRRVNQAQAFHRDTHLGDEFEMPASASFLPPMSPRERVDLSRMARRDFSNDLEAYRFWHDLVKIAAFLQMIEGR